MASLFSKPSKRKRPHGAAAPSADRDDEPRAPAARSANRASGSRSLTATFADLGLCPPLAATCRKLGFVHPTAVQRAIIPQILRSGANNGGPGGSGGSGGGHLLALSATGSGKTAAFALPLLHLLSADPYGIFALVLTPTRELARQIQQQILALGAGAGWKVTCALIIGGEDVTRQGLELGKQPNFVVATPGRCAELCRDGDGGGLYRPNFRKVRFVVLDEADRLLGARSGFERDVAECLLQSTTTTSREAEGRKRVRRTACRTLLFSATMTRSLASLEEMAGAGAGRLPLTKVVVREDGTWDDGEAGAEKQPKKKRKGDGGDGSSSNESSGPQKDETGETSESESGGDSDDEASTPNVPAGLRQEYIFMPSRVREAYLLCAIRTLMTHGGRGKAKKADNARNGSGWNVTHGKNVNVAELLGDDNEEAEESGARRKHPPAQSAIIFVPTCERCAHISGILSELGIKNVALHSLLSQNRRLASLGAFQSQRVRVLVATDVASRGLDVPEVDLVINAELPRRAVDYVHRVGRTARAGRRGRAVSLVGEQDVDLVHAAENISGRSLEKCEEVTDDMAVRMLGPVAKASRLTKMKLMDVGFDELVAKHRERKRRDRRRREKAERRARKAVARLKEKK